MSPKLRSQKRRAERLNIIFSTPNFSMRCLKHSNKEHSWTSQTFWRWLGQTKDRYSGIQCHSFFVVMHPMLYFLRKRYHNSSRSFSRVYLYHRVSSGSWPFVDEFVMTDCDDHLSSLIVKTSKQNKFLNVTRINGWVFYTSSTSTIWCQKHPFSGWCFNWMTPNHSQWKMGVSPFPSMNQKTVALGNYTALNLGKWHDQCTEPPTNGQVIFCLSLSLPKLLLTNHISSWWLNQHMWKICSSKWVHLPEVGVKNTKNLWNHHLAT